MPDSSWEATSSEDKTGEPNTVMEDQQKKEEKVVVDTREQEAGSDESHCGLYDSSSEEEKKDMAGSCLAEWDKEKQRWWKC